VLDPAEPPTDPGDGLLRRPPPPLTWRERLEGLADATGTTPMRVVIGAGAVAVMIALALWLLRPAPPPPEASLPFASTTLAQVVSTTTVPTALVVHVAGAVIAPGVHELPTGSRVVDAIEAAGGTAADADSARINLAAPLVDGGRVYVPAVGEEPPPIAVGGLAGDPGTGPTGPVNLNSADAAALDALPGVGPATAAAILEHRGKVGAFTSVEQLLDVPGIGEAKLDALRDLGTVTP
jgi:competence protein ComEA